jgi:hypothetical protein
MTCPDCGAPDDQGCYRGCRQIERSKRMTITRDRGDWTFVDANGDTWRLRPTFDSGCPLTIEIVQRYQS